MVPMRPRRALKSLGPRATGFEPRTRTLPALGKSEVFKRRRSVVFPAPLGPTIATRSPGAMVRLIGWRASKESNRLAAPSRPNWTAGGGRSVVGPAVIVPLRTVEEAASGPLKTTGWLRSAGASRDIAGPSNAGRQTRQRFRPSNAYSYQ